MPDLLETYSNVCGVPMPQDAPEFPVNYLPTPEKYITFHNSSGGESKQYDYFNEVIELIGPHLFDRGITPVQIGEGKDTPLVGTLHFHNKGYSFRQSSFLVQNALCHVGNDSCHCHTAGAFQTPLVALYGPTDPKSIGPHFRGKAIYLESHRNGNKPTFLLQENPKTINMIKPEAVAAAIAEILEFPYKPEIETVNIGSGYYIRQIDYVPDHPFRMDTGSAKVMVRLDVYPGLQNAMQYLYAAPGRSAVCLDKPFEDIFKLKHKIDKIIYFLRKDYSKDFIDKIQKSGIDYLLISKREVPLGDLKLDLLNYNTPIEEQVCDTPKWEDCFFKTKRFIISHGEAYATLAHLRRGIRTQPGRADKTFFSDPEFQCNSANHYYFKINS